MFSPADGATADEIWNQAVELSNRLRASLGNAWRPEWNDQMAVVERQLLPAMLAHGLEMEGSAAWARDQIELGIKLIARFDCSRQASFPFGWLTDRRVSCQRGAIPAELSSSFDDSNACSAIEGRPRSDQ